MGTSKAKSSLSSVGGGGAAGGGAAGLVRGLVASDTGVAPVPERLFLAAITPNDAPNTGRLAARLKKVCPRVHSSVLS